MLAWLGGRAPSRILLLGGGSAALAPDLRAAGHDVVAVHAAQVDPAVALDGSIVADLDAGVPADAGDGFDVAILVDSLGQVRDPAALLGATRAVLADGGVVLASFPNFGHWYPRARVAIGRFDYDARGILDRGHLRFFTKRSFAHLVRTSGWTIRRQESIGLPLDVVDRGAASTGGGGPRDLVSRVDRALVGLRPQLFAYQFIYELSPTP
jgi:SAM-dependent methyltransferase